MLSREDVLEYGLTFSNVYVDTPFRFPLVKNITLVDYSTFPINR